MNHHSYETKCYSLGKSCVALYSGLKTQAKEIIDMLEKKQSQDNIELTIECISQYIYNHKYVQDGYVEFILAGFRIDDEPIVYHIKKNLLESGKFKLTGSGKNIAKIALVLNMPKVLDIKKPFNSTDLMDLFAVACNETAKKDASVGGKAERMRLIYFDILI